MPRRWQPKNGVFRNLYNIAQAAMTVAVPFCGKYTLAKLIMTKPITVKGTDA